MIAFPLLFTPARIGTMQLRNRIAMSPMENLYATGGGLPSPRTIDYFTARAKGGVGLITVGASAIDARHKEVPNSLHFASDDVVDSHRALTDAVHAHGAKIQPQVVHAGPDGLAPELHRIDAVGPSVIQSNITGTPCRALSESQFADIVDLYRAAAVRVRQSGYDGIELHAAHGYMLLGSFLTPWRNARRDRYSARRGDGGVAAVAEVVRAIKSEVGADFPLTLRVSGYERIAGGRSSYDTQRIAPDLVEAGVDAFHISGGVIDRLVTQMVNGSHYPDGLNIAAATAVKRAVDVPVMVVGRIHTPELAERILHDGCADLIAMGRPMIADPNFVAKARDGQSTRIRLCISCQNCIDSMETRQAMDCAVNPRAGREAELSAVAASRSKEVAVIGSGPAGLEAARVARLRGHRVTLFERNQFLGGALLMAATVHPENQPLLDYLLREVTRLGVRIEKGIDVTAELIESRAADTVVVATGGRLVTPRLAGDDLPLVFTGREIRNLLAGAPAASTAAKLAGWQRFAVPLLRGPARALLHPSLIRRATRHYLPFGEKIVIIGADLAAIELAEFLAERGRTVAILDPGDRIAPEVGDKRRAEHMERLDRAGVPINTGATIDHISNDGVVLHRSHGRGDTLVPADNVIIAGEVAADTSLYDSIKERIAETYAAGDCTGLGLIRKAMLEGAHAATRI